MRAIEGNGLLREGVTVTDASDDYALIAVQGPLSRTVLGACDFFAGVSDQQARADLIAYLQEVTTAN